MAWGVVAGESALIGSAVTHRRVTGGGDGK